MKMRNLVEEDLNPRITKQTTPQCKVYSTLVDVCALTVSTRALTSLIKQGCDKKRAKI
jgi:hypothetical protein